MQQGFVEKQEVILGQDSEHFNAYLKNQFWWKRFYEQLLQSKVVVKKKTFDSQRYMWRSFD